MKEKQKNPYVGHSVRFTKKELRTKWALVVLAVLIVAISSVSIWNAAGLQAAVDRRTRMYVSDVSLQLMMILIIVWSTSSQTWKCWRIVCFG